ncbi:MAG: ABC transporter ATP-binding protein [Desulfovibrionaceae bacterium]|jgi:branched-chain amino acid transport system ATP-binding protein|nr:ABC transporter ATP-binding protein [Desulfovibrionaceae bacterium]
MQAALDPTTNAGAAPAPNKAPGAAAAESAGEPILEVRGVSKRFGGLLALGDVDYTVPRGRIMGLIGPNGAGKTTMFNCITGVYKPSVGDILFRRAPGAAPVRTNGFKPEKMTALGIARTFQNIRLFSDLTVLDNVRIGRHARTRQIFLGAVLRTRGQKREEERIVEDSMRWLDFVGLGKHALAPASGLAYGHQRRLEIARALATEPGLLLLDEPAAGMNPQETQMLDELIHRILDQGITVVLIEHDMKLVMHICDKLVVLDHGIKIADGTPEEIRRDPRVVEAYLGRGAADA